MPTEDTIVRSVRLPEGVDEKLVAAAERANKSVNAFIREILERASEELAAKPESPIKPVTEARK
jgi:predicted DNA-binding protein